MGTFFAWIAAVFFTLLAGYDLLQGKMPLWCIILFLAACTGEYLQKDRFMMLAGVMDLVTVTVPAVIMAKKKVLGNGDCFLAAGLCLWLSPMILSESLVYGLLHCAISALIISVFHLPQKKLPLIPFLWLGVVMCQEAC